MEGTPNSKRETSRNFQPLTTPGLPQDLSGFPLAFEHTFCFQQQKVLFLV